MLSDEDRTFLYANSLGGVVSGLWKKSIIVDNDCYFPERTLWEDNYWGIFITSYLCKICLVDEVLYLYRQRSSSTVHRVSPESISQRISSERKAVRRARELGILDRYYDALEYIYIFRYAINTSMLILRVYGRTDHAYKMIRDIADDLEKTFPHWKKNAFYLKDRSPKEKLKTRLFLFHTNMFFHLQKIYQTVKYLFVDRPVSQ